MKKQLILMTLILAIILLFNKATADTRPNNNNLGYELIGSGNNTILHIWNKYWDYYINDSTGLQFSDKPHSFFTYNVFCIQGVSTAELCTNKTGNFVRYPIKSDNLTYINVTYHRNTANPIFNFTYGLTSDEKNLTIVTNLRSPINLNNIKFKWKTINIRIDNTTINDYLLLNNDANKYNLSSTSDKNFNNLTAKVFKLLDMSSVYLYWFDTNYNLIVQSQAGQYNSPIILQITRNITANTNSNAKYKWNDPACNIFAQPNWSLSVYCTPPLNITANGWVIINSGGTLNLIGNTKVRAKQGVAIATGGIAQIKHGELQVGQEPPA